MDDYRSYRLSGAESEVTLREKGEVEVLPMTREELNFTDEEQVKTVS